MDRLHSIMLRLSAPPPAPDALADPSTSALDLDASLSSQIALPGESIASAGDWMRCVLPKIRPTSFETENGFGNTEDMGPTSLQTIIKSKLPSLVLSNGSTSSFPSSRSVTGII
jgi:hypothetical protein